MEFGVKHTMSTSIIFEVITRMLQALAEGDKSRKIYERLNTLHDTTRVHLTMMRSAPMQVSSNDGEKISFIDITMAFKLHWSVNY